MAGSLYRKYRPQRFAELIGQKHVARALQNALAEGRLAHAYLFSGTRGTGKTSTARILGAVLNCQQFVNGFGKDPAEIEPCGECDACVATRMGNAFDVIELDAASNNGVDDIRELVEKVSYTSAVGGTKVYIIDEVHELTGRASNALLKTLEEPPDHVVFILATTNPEKVIPTIRSRTQHFEFVSPDDTALFAHAKEILSWEERHLDDDAIEFVVRKGAGSVRDMLSYLDQVLALGVTTLDELQVMSASTDSANILALIGAVADSDIARAMENLHILNSSGKEPRAIVENIITYARDCLVLSLNPATSILLSPHLDKKELSELGKKCGTNFLRRFILTLGKAVSDMRSTASLNPLLSVEIALLSAMNAEQSRDTAPNEKLRSEVKAKSSSTQDRTTRVSSLKESPKSESKEKTPRATLGALKRDKPGQADTSGVSESASTTATPKVVLEDIVASWPKVVSLLSVASQDEIKKAIPIKLEGDVLTFSVPDEELEAVKARFKKDASIVRGFLESLHEKEFRFQIVAGTAHEVELPTPQVEVDIREDTETLMEESEEYNPVDTVVSLFGGEVVSE